MRFLLCCVIIKDKYRINLPIKKRAPSSPLFVFSDNVCIIVIEHSVLNPIPLRGKDKYSYYYLFFIPKRAEPVDRYVCFVLRFGSFNFWPYFSLIIGKFFVYLNRSSLTVFLSSVIECIFVFCFILFQLFSGALSQFGERVFCFK